MSHTSTLYTVLIKLEQASKLLRTRTPPLDMPLQVEVLLAESVVAIRKTLEIKPWPEPTVDEPDFHTLEEWMWEDGASEATDGCVVEPDGTCPHNHPSWLLKLGLI